MIVPQSSLISPFSEMSPEQVREYVAKQGFGFGIRLSRAKIERGTHKKKRCWVLSDSDGIFLRVYFSTGTMELPKL